MKLRYPPKLVLDGDMKEIGHVGGPDEEANFEEHHHSALPKASDLDVGEPVTDANNC